MLCQVRGGVFGPLPVPKREGRLGPHHDVATVQRLDGQPRRACVEPDMSECRRKPRRAPPRAGPASITQRRPRAVGPADRQRPCVVGAVRRIDVRQLQQKRLARGSERGDRRGAPAAGQRLVVQAHHQCLQRSRIAQIADGIQRGGADLRLGIVERRHDCGRVRLHLKQPEPAQRARPPPPETAVQPLFEQRHHRHRQHDAAHARDERRIPILEERCDQQKRDRDPVSRTEPRPVPAPHHRS